MDRNWRIDTSDAVSVILDVTDPLASDYGAKLVLKTESDTETDDVVIASIPGTRDVDERGNLIVAENEFLLGEKKSGSLHLRIQGL